MAEHHVAHLELNPQLESFVLAKDGTRIDVSAEDFDRVNNLRWRIQRHKTGHQYAYSSVKGQNPIAMHRFILDATKGLQVDHKDNNGLNNIRQNIRLCSPKENQANKSCQKDNNLGVKGVWKTKYGKFKAGIHINGKSIHIGSYPTSQEASNAYKKAAAAIWGDFHKA